MSYRGRYVSYGSKSIDFNDPGHGKKKQTSDKDAEYLKRLCVLVVGQSASLMMESSAGCFRIQMAHKVLGIT